MTKKFISGRKLEELIGIIERNRQENKSKRREETEAVVASEAPAETSELVSEEEIPTDPDLDPADVRVVVFAAESPFLSSIVEMLSNQTVVAAFQQPEEAINFILDYNIKHVILDLDQPTEHLKSIDVFSATKTIHPDIRVYCAAKNIYSPQVSEFKHKGAIILAKPILRKQTEEIASRIK